MRKILLNLALLVSAASLSSAQTTLFELDFERSPFSEPAGALPANNFDEANSQLTIDSAVTIESNVTIIGASANTAQFQYIGDAGTSDGDITSLYGTDLFNSVGFASFTRVDIDLGLAAAGQSYTITGVEIDVTAAIDDSGDAGTSEYSWGFGYRDATTGNGVTLNGGTIALKAASTGTTTYSITGLSLQATDSATDWSRATNGEVRFLFAESNINNVDDLRIDAIRIISVPEPGTYALFAGWISLALIALRRRRRA